jgi:hypothetical protein
MDQQEEDEDVFSFVNPMYKGNESRAETSVSKRELAVRREDTTTPRGGLLLGHSPSTLEKRRTMSMDENTNSPRMSPTMPMSSPKALDGRQTSTFSAVVEPNSVAEGEEDLVGVGDEQQQLDGAEHDNDQNWVENQPQKDKNDTEESEDETARKSGDETAHESAQAPAFVPPPSAVRPSMIPPPPNLRRDSAQAPTFVPPPSAVRPSMIPPPLNLRRDSALPPPPRKVSFGALMMEASERKSSALSEGTVSVLSKIEEDGNRSDSDGEDGNSVGEEGKATSSQKNKTEEHIKCHPYFEYAALTIQTAIAMVSCWSFVCSWFAHRDEDRAGNVKVWRNNTLFYENEYAYTMITHENFVMTYLLSSGLHLFSLTLGLFIALHNPRKNWGISESLSSYLICIDRIIFVTPSISEGYVKANGLWQDIVVSLMDVGFVIAVIKLIKNKRREAKMLPDEKLRRLVYSSLPRTIGTCLVSLCFLFSETAGCFMRYRGESLKCRGEKRKMAGLPLPCQRLLPHSLPCLRSSPQIRSTVGPCFLSSLSSSPSRTFACCLSTLGSTIYRML